MGNRDSFDASRRLSDVATEQVFFPGAEAGVLGPGRTVADVVLRSIEKERAATVEIIAVDRQVASGTPNRPGPPQQPVADAALEGGAVGTDAEIAAAVETPPQTTRARLRGEFIKRAKERRRDYTVDWVHLKLNDQAQRTVLCKDPFKAYDERVEKLIESL